MGLVGFDHPTAEDAMKLCVKWGNKGVSIRSYKYGLTSHARECLYDKKSRQVIGFEGDSKDKESTRKRVKYFRY